MNIAVFGATGGTGRQVVEQALAAGHSVRALVRNDAARLAITDPQLSVVVGDVLDPVAVGETLTGAEAVVVSLGNTSSNPDWIVSKGTRTIIDAMEAQGPRRLIVVSSIGVGDSKDQVPFAFKMLMKTVLKKAMEDKERQEQSVRASDLVWTIVRPGGLTNGPKTGKYHVATDGSVSAGQVSRADVADFVLKQLSDSSFIRMSPSIS